MLRIAIFAAFLQCTISQQYQQKVAPGVPPQNYQNDAAGNYQPPPPPPPQGAPQQQYQQPQQPQLQQTQQSYQQYQQPPQQPPQQHGGHAHHGDPMLLNPANIAEEREHIQEHMDVPIDTSKMSEQELQFHYFKMHDADNNNKLDGCELIKSLIHWHVHEDQRNDTKIYTDDELSHMIDEGLKTMDGNNDGFIDYAELRVLEDKIKT